MSSSSKSRSIDKVVPATVTNPSLQRLIGTVDVDGQGTQHALEEVDPFMLLDQGILRKDAMPPFGVHPHRGHSVVTLLFKGRVKSWDSFSQKETVVEGPASYWVDAGSGVFHDETSVIEDESDINQHAGLLQLWIGVKESDRLKPALCQYEESPPLVDAMSSEDEKTVVGKIRYYVGGENQSIETPHPVIAAHVHQYANTKFKFPINPKYGGFLVNLNGSNMLEGDNSNTGPPADAPTLFGRSSTKSTKTNDILVLADGNDSEDHIEIITSEASSADYMVCIGEKHGEQWSKKLVANGAVIAKDEQEAREIATKVEGYAQTGKSAEGGRGSFAPFGV